MSTVIGAGIRGARGRRFRGAPLKLSGGAAAPAYQFYIKGDSLTVNVLGDTPMSLNNQAFTIQPAVTPLAQVTGGYYYSPPGDGFAQIWNTPSHSDGIHSFCTIGAGQVTGIVKWTSAMVSGARVWALEGSESPPSTFDTQDSLEFINAATTSAVRLVWKGVNGTSTAVTGDLTIPSFALGVDYAYNIWYNKDLSRKLILQFGTEPPVVFTGSLPVPQTPAWNVFRIGKDATAGQTTGVGSKEMYGYKTAAYFLTVYIWQDFEFATFNQANLEASDHNAAVTWDVSDATNLFSTVSVGRPLCPCRINNIVDSGTRVLRRKLDSTAIPYCGATFATFELISTGGFWLYNLPTLTNNTEVKIGFVCANTSNYNLIFMYKNEAGQHKIRLRNRAAVESTGAINVTPGDTLGCTWYYERSATCLLDAFTTTGVAVGTQLSVAAPAADGDRFYFGDLEAPVAQPANTVLDVFNLVIDANISLPLPVYPCKPFAS